MMTTTDYNELVEITRILFPELVFDLYVGNNLCKEVPDNILLHKPQLRLYNDRRNFADAFFHVRERFSLHHNVKEVIIHLDNFIGTSHNFKHRNGFRELTEDVFPKKKHNQEMESTNIL